MGVEQIAVIINQMDTVDYKEEAYNKVRMYCTPSEIIDKENK